MKKNFVLDKYKNQFREFLKEKKYYLSLFGRGPGDDWKIILLTFLFVLGLISASGILTYQHLLDVSNISAEENIASPRILDPKDVDPFINKFIER